MSPELIQLLRDWSFGIFLVAITLIWAIENVLRSFAKRNRPIIHKTESEEDE